MRKIVVITVLSVLIAGVVLAQINIPSMPQQILQDEPKANPSGSILVPSILPSASPTTSTSKSVAVGTNQLINPCFDGPHNGDSLNWTEAPPGGWDVSANKNPCGPNQTAARLNDPSLAGQSQPNVHEYISQVVSGHGATLTVQMACIQHFALIGDTNIYGGGSANGPWTQVWRPFTLSDCSISTLDDRGWKPVKQAQTTLPQSYPYYKIEFHAMRDADGGGIKFTSAYFNSQ